jgi:hypothetical protein
MRLSSKLYSSRRGLLQYFTADDGSDAAGMEVLISGANHFVSLASGLEEDKNIGGSVNGRQS